MKHVIILGSTGSIGTQALDVVREHPHTYQIDGLGAGGQNLTLLAQQAYEFDVPYVAIAQLGKIPAFLEVFAQITPKKQQPEVFEGDDAMAQLARSARCEGVVLNGITGSVGLKPTLAALESGATLALANKESLVAGGGLISGAMRRPGQIVPVDSEHSALAQALSSGVHNRGLTSLNLDGESNVRRLILTASGGPFRGKKRADLAAVSPEQALNHPTWAMGPVVTINSSTLMNKALELIEAAYLFDIAPQDIVPVVHPQSIVHSMVEFHDGSTIAQASPPDMKLPIALGLSWPQRLEAVAQPCAWDGAQTWTFEPLDHETFPAIEIARMAVAQSSLHPAVMNAANEECVAAFLAGALPYLDIVDVVREVLDSFEAQEHVSLEIVGQTERWARTQARELIARRGK
ncbi:1-deoxy-D-xylulose-5-phosphate reductoisomerase [Arcanobacterium pluranimalium]|uniref:1-deoxy-D-xylulose-5-phosphate reductoisomerase n=1 Tax=Arcanobacterium pluranimalium TaxID=108028 RepID=UPI001957F11D|nr:1-deoxy-D-xylulose-5-phosphate reductoisomerase [Arcanobacterium pluranimalium]MBM7825649.1 1-deoxy-D-xylulose-5-phosphate reductoisomerase [Arcanobacterium pluranimalium]